MKRFIKNKKGFTLIELIVVIAILGILAGIAIPRFGGFQETAKKNADIANGKNAASIISAMMANNKIKADATNAQVSTISDINDYFPNGIPTLQTTSVAGQELYYSCDVAKGSVIIYGGKLGDDNSKLYPTVGGTFK